MASFWSAQTYVHIAIELTGMARGLLVRLHGKMWPSA